jgi:ribosomal protein S18 acetylase RimI-like enzyme
LSSPLIVNATPSDRGRTVGTLVSAFASDPFVRWMLPKPHQYRAYFSQLLGVFADTAFEHHSVYRAKDFMAAAIWIPPGIHVNEESLGAVMQTAIDDTSQEDVFTLLEQVSKFHPEGEHWYLPVIGVDPMCQGAGYGSALLARSLAVCDRIRRPAYLESTNPRNIPLYERFGFEVAGEVQVGSSPTIWPMVRTTRKQVSVPPLLAGSLPVKS